MKHLRWALLLALSTFLLCNVSFANDPAATAVGQSTGGDDSPDLLGVTFESESAGISLRIPKGCQRIQSTNTGDDVAQFGDPRQKWELKITRILRDGTTSLVTTSDNLGKPIPGLLEQTAGALKHDLSGSTILRQDVTNIADAGLGETKLVNNVGMIAIRYSAAGAHFVSQQAIIQATDRLFYLISLTNPVKEAVGPGAAPADDERTPVRAFGQMLDSVRLLDTVAIRREQEDRLNRTRALFVQLKNRTRVRSILVNEQWLRVTRSGRDIGYSYITEQTAEGVPRPLSPKEVLEGRVNDRDLVKNGEGVLIGVRSRSTVPAEINVDGAAPDSAHAKPRGPVQVDNATWMFVGPEQDVEDWSRITVVDDGALDKDNNPALRRLTEFGSSTIQVKSELDPNLPKMIKGDLNQPPVIRAEHHRLDVTTLTDTGASDPMSQEVPKFYISQATGHLLPRLVVLMQRSYGEPRTYMFATYVSDTRQVMTRYVEVGDEGDFKFAGQIVHALPVTDRLGWRGSITTHYITRDGKYLGSENKDTHIVIVPSDAQTLVGIWRGANLTQPGMIQRPAGPPRPAATPAPQSGSIAGPPQPAH